MTDNSENEEQMSNADKLISSYLGDMFGPVTQSVEVDDPLLVEAGDSRLQADPESAPRQICVEAATIERHHSLISTLDLMAAFESHEMLDKAQSFLMLLISLYYLRRPLPSRVKQKFLDVSERMLDDYEAAQWQAHIPRPNGVLSEARS